MTFVEMVQFVEEVYALVQQLKSNGTLDKFIAAEQAAQTELETDPIVLQIEAKIEAFFTKKAVATAAQAASGAKA